MLSEQFHKMNAHINYCGGVIEFYSYSSLIIVQTSDTKFIITGRYNYSPTTSRQFSRYLIERTRLAYNYDDVRDLRKRLDDCISGECFTFNNCEVCYIDYYELSNLRY